ncbi:response regulator transcription factor [Fulvivirga sp. M361]|uniref:LytR/AlgR family response regulator transcription factor n=1 Tax=Fulvivirga sp. M361 TaxID=2594266 RepID=UPI00117A8DCB|nr:LytTR family DNA-binding domain-containing protein [Fulvivirga sp. M361]TRX56125.1 response regulator transcription factor [Fulvivirga sp. M361]
MKIKTLIVDDEPMAIRVIQNYLEKFDDFDLVAISGDPVEAFDILKNECIDLIFLDINLPMISGLEFLKSLRSPPSCVITTAYREYAVESFELNVLDYLMKPISFNRFLKTIDKINHQFYPERAKEGAEGEDYMFIKVDKRMIRVELSDILYIESLKDYIKIVTGDDNYITHQSLIGIGKVLPENRFLRIHRSYTVAIDKITMLEGNSVKVGCQQLPIGRNFQTGVKKIILKKSLD